MTIIFQNFTVFRDFFHFWTVLKKCKVCKPNSTLKIIFLQFVRVQDRLMYFTISVGAFSPSTVRGLLHTYTRAFIANYYSRIRYKYIKKKQI